MAGLYIHVPFCRKACHYCDFHFSTSLNNKKALIDALIKEMDIRKGYLESTISTLYFGGGTPSLLSQDELTSIFSAIERNFKVNKEAEITLEANPDDINKEKIAVWKESGINRLSIGVQSFYDFHLAAMNRMHTAQQAIEAVKIAQSAGIENISIDLIYGLPGLTFEQWKYNLQIVFDLNVPHLSAYCLTVEEKTALAHFIKAGKIVLPGEDETVEQFNLLMDETKKNGFIHYEISNFCKPGFHSKHNSSYWTGEHYLGIGPSAHSFNGVSRQFNVANNAKYIKGINSGKPEINIEILTEADKYNEYIMTGIRTISGVNKEFIGQEFGAEYLKYFLAGIEPFILSKHLEWKGEHIILTRKGKLFTDKIASGLFTLS